MRARSTLLRAAGLAAGTLLLAACSTLGGAGGTPAPSGNPCQPTSNATPAPPPASPAAISQAEAEAIGIALFRACESPPVIVSNLTAATSSASGSRVGPNAGQPVWLVKVDAKVAVSASPAQFYYAHFLIEVNAATGVATIIGQG